MGNPNENQNEESILANKLSESVQKFIDENGIQNMICLARKPNSDDTAIFFHGHFYDVAALLGEVYSKFKEKINKDLP